MKKLLYCFIFASLMVLLAAVPASASNYHQADISSFEDLQTEMEALNDEGVTDTIIVFDIHNDITFTETIDIAIEDVEIQFNSADEDEEFTFLVDNCLAFDINLNTDDVHLIFEGIKFEDKMGVQHGSSARGIEVSNYSDGCVISGAYFDMIGGSEVDRGGAIYVNNHGCTISNCTFNKCHAEKEGGAVYINGDNVMVNGCTFTDCGASDYGACICVDGGQTNVEIKECTFNMTQAIAVALAVYGSGEEEEYTKITNCTPANGWRFYQNCYCPDPTGSLISEGSVCIAAGIAILAGACFALFRRKKSTVA